MANIADNILDAVEILVNNSMQQAKFDKTIQATIIECTNSANGKYKLKFQDSYFYAFSSDLSKVFSKDTVVNVLVPEGDMSKNKVILGEVTKRDDESNVSPIVNERDKFEMIGEDCIKDQKTPMLDINTTGNGTLDLLSGQSKDYIFLNDNFKIYVEDAKYIALGATFRTSIPDELKSGTCYIIYSLSFKKPDETEITRQYTVGINDLNGDPRNCVIPQEVIKFFEIEEGEKFLNLDFIKIVWKFDNDAGKQAQIEISNLTMQAANRIEQSDIDSFYMTLTTPYGSIFNEEDTGEREDKIIKAHFFIKGKEMTNTSSDLKFLWFIEDFSVNRYDHPQYSRYGDLGWRCINEPSIEEVKQPIYDINKEEWTTETKQISHSFVDYGSTYIVNKNNIKIQSQRIKCVIVYGKGSNETSLSKKITFFNNDAVNQFTLDAKTVFYSNMDYLSSDKQISAKYESVNKLTLYWGTENVYGKRDFLKSDSSSLVLEFNPKNIVMFNDYICSIYEGSNFIGTQKIRITNAGEKSSTPLYTILLKNADMVFAYNEDGTSPYSEMSIRKPEIGIQELEIIGLFDNLQGIELDIDKKSMEIDWILPNADNTLLQIKETADNLKNTTKLSYSIAPVYNASKKDNTIQARVRYNGVTTQAFTNFIFSRVGEMGTNGTEYIAQIVPNEEEYEYKDWITLTNTKGVWEFNFTSIGEKPFLTKVWKNGNLITEGVEYTFEPLSRKYLSNLAESELLSCVNNIISVNNSSLLELTDIIKKGSEPLFKYSGIIKSTVKVDDTQLYSTLPIGFIYNENSDIDIKISGGFKYVQYTNNGTKPTYNSKSSFTVDIYTKGTDSNINEGYIFTWIPTGVKVNGKNFIKDDTLLTLKNAENKNQIIARPANQYDGLAYSTGLICKITSANENFCGWVFFPIHFYLNRYPLANLNTWDGNSVEIKQTDEDGGGYILAPQIGAGHKENDNSFTGLVMGESAIKKGENIVKQTGLMAYNKGQQTFFLNADDGSASFGTLGTGQINIVPGDDPTIKGGRMTINFGNSPSITFNNSSNKKIFHVDDQGNIEATSATLYNASLKDGFRLQGDENSEFIANLGSSYLKFSGSDTGNQQAKIYGKKVNNGNQTFMQIDLLKPLIQGGIQQGDDDNPGWDGDDVDSPNYHFKIDPEGFYFGCAKYKVGDQEKGGSIQFRNGELKISGTLNADFGVIGGWTVGANNLSSGGFSINAATKGKNNAYIQVTGDETEIRNLYSTESGKERTVSLQKGGIYFYPFVKNSVGDVTGWQGRIYLNSKVEDKALTITSRGGVPIHFFGADIDETGTKDHLIMQIVPKETAGDDYVRIGYSSTPATDNSYTTLYRKHVDTLDVNINYRNGKKQLNTKSQNLVGAINEIYPGSSLNIQHAIIVGAAELNELVKTSYITYKKDTGFVISKSNISIICQGYAMQLNTFSDGYDYVYTWPFLYNYVDDKGEIHTGETHGLKYLPYSWKDCWKTGPVMYEGMKEFIFPKGFWVNRDAVKDQQMHAIIKKGPIEYINKGPWYSSSYREGTPEYIPHSQIQNHSYKYNFYTDTGFELTGNRETISYTEIINNSVYGMDKIPQGPLFFTVQAIYSPDTDSKYNQGCGYVSCNIGTCAMHDDYYYFSYAAFGLTHLATLYIPFASITEYDTAVGMQAKSGF